MVALDTLYFAVECISTLDESFGKKDNVVKKFRARARDLAGFAYYNDLAYLFAYIAAKSGSEEYIVGELVRKDLNEITQRMKSENKSEEEKSYALYGAFLSKFIHEHVGIFEGGNPPKELGAFLLKLREASVIITPFILELSEWLKRLAESKFESE